MYVSWTPSKTLRLYGCTLGHWSLRSLTGDAKNLLVEIRCKAYSSFHL